MHPTFDVRIFHKECCSLVKAGFDVSLVAVHEKDETINGVKILGLPRPRRRLERWLNLRSECLNRALETQAELFHFHDPELIPVGLKLKALGFKVIYDVHEFHSKSVLDRHYLPVVIRQPIANYMRRLEEKADQNLDGIVIVTAEMRAQFPRHDCVLVQNFPIESELFDSHSPPIANRNATVCYVGGLTAVRGAKEMIRAIAEIPDAKLLLLGPIVPESLRAELELEPGWKQVEYRGVQDREGVARALNESVAGLVVLHQMGNFLNSQPLKMFEYMAAGIPFIASDFPKWRELVGDSSCGKFISPQSVGELVLAIRNYLNNRIEAESDGNRGRETARQNFTWQSQAENLIGLYRNLLDS